jgi:two-component system LytT family response regulator
MLRTIIIDDETNARKALTELIKAYCQNIEVVGEASGVEEGILAINKLNPDFIFLDVNMKDGSGFDLLERMEFKAPKVIFVTAYDSFAISAFRHSASDYILKPVDPGLLVSAVEKVRRERNQNTFNNQLQSIIERDSDSKKLAFPTYDKIEFIKPSEILRCESSSNMTIVYMVDGSDLVVARPLKDYESILEPYGFFRIHKSHLINLSYVKTYMRGDNKVIMDDGVSLDISRRKKEPFMSKMMNIK